MSTVWLRYVPHSEIVRYLARGWRISDELHGTNHGNYSVLMCTEREPEPEDDDNGQVIKEAAAGTAASKADAGSQRQQEEIKGDAPWQT